MQTSLSIFSAAKSCESDNIYIQTKKVTCVVGYTDVHIG